ncbi:MAG: phenylalanine--tRNA ligase subunit beta [Sphaerochaeta sp.]|jgi:phenylalanyl-tRNA synthetase beta chain|nr:phenylalanine--tRNA ligase subunit beta [Sphaerochaeta sp.]MCI2076530.1 phenylalanine--tRNA ligase subunit beta [Sphaerochaeta sp.]MCI2103576.1 phenylalanine--tRNA ligase subunit beta [Sphaerochaeta sp.]
MPKIETSENLFFRLLGKRLSDQQMMDIFPVAKAELDGHADGVVKIELNDTNRPDLWSAAGVARALKAYGGESYEYDFFSTAEETMDAEGRDLYIDASAKPVRAYDIGFAVSGHAITEEELLALIQSQEKLCDGYGRKRRNVAVGIYRSDMITYPVHYAGVNPDTTRFQPLGSDEEMSLREILEKHPKGKEYGYIVADKPVFPYLTDDNGGTLSFPPVINSAKIGAVKVGDSDLFVEMSGPELEPLLLVAAILACDMADMGWTIKPVKCHFPEETPYGKEITVPYYFQQPVSCQVSLVQKTLGEKLSGAQCVEALKKMGEYAICDNDVLYVTVPEYRNDFLHPVDVVEDVMIGYGLNNFKPEPPHDFTIGRLTDAEMFGRSVKRILVGMGFQEMMYNYLGSRKEYIDNMHVDGSECIFIANPMTENFEVVRPSILPSLLESESVSAHAPFPHKIFEVGKVAYKDPSDNSGTTTRNHLGFMMSDIAVGYNDVSSVLYTLMYFLKKEYTLGEVEGDPRFIPGRCARVLVDGKPVGIFGEVHPQVLESWGCGYPVVLCELDLDLLRN